MQTARNPRKVCSRLGLAFAAMLVVVLASQLGLTLLAYVFAPWFTTHEAGTWLLTDASIYLFGAPVYLLILRTIPNGQEGQREKLRMNPWKYLLVLVVCLGVAYAASFLTVFFLLIVETLKNSPVQAPEFFVESGFLVSLFFGAVVPALGEEYLFRYCLRKKLRGSGDKIYILFSSLCFAVFHMNMSQLVFTFFVGAIFAWIYTQTGSIWYSVSLHFLFNSVSLVLAQLEEEFFSLMIGYVALMFVFIAASITTLVLSMRYIRSHLRPPEEAGWPHKAPAAKYAPQPLYQPAAYNPQPYYGGSASYGYGAPPPSYNQPPYAPQPYYAPPPSYGYSAQGVPPVHGYAYPQAQPGYGTPAPHPWQQTPPAPIVQDCPELAHAGYNNMPGNHTPPAYQNMRPVWPGEAGQNTPQPTNFGAVAMPPLFGPGQQSNSIFKTCFLNTGMVLYLLGGFAVIVVSLLV